MNTRQQPDTRDFIIDINSPADNLRLDVASSQDIKDQKQLTIRHEMNFVNLPSVRREAAQLHRNLEGKFDSSIDPEEAKANDLAIVAMLHADLDELEASCDTKMHVLEEKIESHNINENEASTQKMRAIFAKNPRFLNWKRLFLDCDESIRQLEICKNPYFCFAYQIYPSRAKKFWALSLFMLALVVGIDLIVWKFYRGRDGGGPFYLIGCLTLALGALACIPICDIFHCPVSYPEVERELREEIYEKLKNLFNYLNPLLPNDYKVVIPDELEITHRLSLDELQSYFKYAKKILIKKITISDQAFAFFNASHSRLGKKSALHHHFFKNPLYEPHLRNSILTFLPEKVVLEQTVNQNKR